MKTRFSKLARLLEAGLSLSSWARRLCVTPQARLVLVAALTAFTLGGGGKDPRGGSELLEWVGSWPGFTRGPAMSVALTDHYAYVAIGEGGLAILDVTDPTRPVPGWRLPASGPHRARATGRQPGILGNLRPRRRRL